MHISPFTPIPKQVRRDCRQLAMEIGVCCLLAGVLCASLMFWVAPLAPDALLTPLTELLGDWVFTFILGTLAAISCAWVPAHDDLIRRKDEPFYQGVHVRRIILICRLFSISLLRATPPPRTLHR